ncbi:MAG: YlxR family protein [Oscillospiraceae bacterium]|nr:YlxR family protein [Oscillospiraceae bacterium]
MKQKKIPMRQCIGCREMHPKKELMRVVKSKDGEIAVDSVGKLPGRGAYICRGEACLAKAQKTKAIERAFETTISPEVYELLRAALSEVDDGE